MNQKSYISGDHLVICDSCGAQRYRSQCKYTWDGYLMCTVLNCWYPKHPLFEIPPVINDPMTLYDVRPDQVLGSETYVDNIVGLITTFDNCHNTFSSFHKILGHVDDAPNYTGL